MSSAGTPVPERDRAIGLYTFLKEFVQLRTKTIHDIARYERDGQVIWAVDIPQERGCFCIARRREAADESGAEVPEDVRDEVWIEIRKPRRRDPPDPPQAVRHWVNREQLHDSDLEVPDLFDEILGDDVDDPPIKLSDHPEVQKAWEDYIVESWWPWAEQDRLEKKVQEVYGDLFAMFQRQQREGERFEVIFGLGFLSWQPPAGHPVKRHLVTAQVTVCFDTETGTLTVTPAGEGARPTLEQDMLDPRHLPDSQELHSIEATLEQLGDSLWDAGPLDGVLKSWAHSASAEGEYSATLERPDSAGPAPRVHLAPALILRPRTERSFISAFEEIIDQLNADHPLPEACRTFVRDAEDSGRGAAPTEISSGAGPSEIYFPLPANDAQREIVRRLPVSEGVLVQGPPGTGKSHTIVNLICHALAAGQRVLVTSQAQRALKVLRRMIQDRVPDMAPLSVVLLGDDRGSLLAMEQSVRGITTRQNAWNSEESQQRIAQLESGLDRQRRREAGVLQDLRVIRERETTQDSRFGYTGTLACIADTLRNQRESLGWISDATPEDADLPLSAVEFDELVSLAGDECVSQWAAAGWSPVDLDRIPATEVFEQAVRVELEALENYEKMKPVRQRPGYVPLRGMTADDRRRFGSGLRKLQGLIDRIERHTLPWTGTATRDVLGDYQRTWRQLHDDTSATAALLAEAASWLDDNPIGPESQRDLRRLRADANDMLEHLRNGGKWGLGPFRAAVARRALYLRDLRIGGRPCTTVETLGDLVRRVDAELQIDALRKRWEQYHHLPTTTFTTLAAELRDLCEPVRHALTALETKRALAEILRRTAGSAEPEWSSRSALIEMSETVDAVDTTLRYEAARSQLDDISEELAAQRNRGGLDPIVKRMQAAVQQRDPIAYAAARKQAAANVEASVRFDRKERLLRRLTAAAPQVAGELDETADDGVWSERGRKFEHAWNWSRARAWLTRLADPRAEDRSRAELDLARKQIAHTLERIAAEKAWRHCFSRMTPNERQHLVAWSKAVKAIGKGTGKYAAQNRRHAHEHLNECRSAIPAWVMPLHRVADTIKPGSELFDIAILDEASQSGPEALLLAWMAKKLVVVGDDKQIQPTYVVEVSNVLQLRDRHIRQLPHADAYGVNHSFFDLAEIRYEGRIRLREHFRCMPEIIQFSNNLSYADEPLIPLRQYGAGRLEPTVTARHVPDGYQKGTSERSVNPPEAKAVVDEIVQICADPAYAGRTIGVISLVGEAQARDIERLLLSEMGPEEIERRQLVCGNAYAFQGDERDVMFLSMVSAAQDGRRIRAMTDAATQRRFNVAASRARDQLYLFHTATLDDLKPDCLRRQLLQYCQDPKVTVADVDGIDVAELERVAVQVDRERGNQPTPFDSWFELDVFLRIVRRGYRVRPQYEIGGYRIDLAVQGMDGSLAVECDGDAWHGAERYEQDAARQRDLERCGWIFWRVRESVFRLDPDDALRGLWETLDAQSICPDRTAPDTRERTKRGEDDKREATPPENRPVEYVPGANNTERLTANGEMAKDRPPLFAPVDGLDPYVEWTPSGSVPDPRTAQQDELVELLAEVVRREGPVVAVRAYRLINLASGSQRLTAPAQRALNRACYEAVRVGEVLATNPLQRAGQMYLVLRNPDGQRVVPRERGPRELDEIPPDELAAMLRRLRDTDGVTEPDTLKRQVLNELGWVRLTRKVGEYLDECPALMERDDEPG